MKALSIRQPWAWLIVHGGKDIENRSWATSFRGIFFVHAAAGMTMREYDSAQLFAKVRGVEIPPAEALQRGGIIGRVEMTGYVLKSDSPWFEGPCGFVLRNPVALRFHPMKGRLGFFEVR